MERELAQLLAYWVITGVLGGYVLSRLLFKQPKKASPGDIVWLTELSSLNKE